MRSFATPSISPTRPVTVFGRKLIICRIHTVPLVLGSPCGLELLIPDVVVLGILSGDAYGATLVDRNVVRDKALPGAIVAWATGVRGTIGASCEPALVEIRPVLG